MTAPQRILLTADAVGGVWQYSVDLARGLSRLGIETVLAVLGPSPSAAQKRAARSVPRLKMVDTGLALDWLADEAGTLRRAGEAVARLAAKHEADLVQLNMPALAAEVRFDRPVVAVLHSCVASWWRAVNDGPLPPHFEWLTERVRLGVAAADAVVTPSAAFGRAAQACYALPETPRTVHNGRSSLVSRAQAPHDFVFTSGRLWDRGKNVGVLDAAAAKIGVPVHAAGPLQGPNGERAAFRHLHALGNLDEPSLGRWLAARPVFASAALYEPFGLSVLEAAAAGCALVLSDIPTFRELWDEVAIFVDPRDSDTYARALNALVSDDFERAVLGRAAQERAARFTPDAMAAQMASLYRSLLPAVRRPVLAARVAA
jgi:glycosyltransferase involved in cell wall biosynthesis